jgi:rSAM/selenodomain-associated transferase 2
MARVARPPLSIIIPALDAAAALPAALAALDEGRLRELVREVLLVDGGSRDATPAIAHAGGARVVAAPRGRGVQLAAGGAIAAGDWLLFLHADTRLSSGWARLVSDFIGDARNRERAAHFRYRLDDASRAARRVEAAVAWRCRRLALPYGDQGLLIAAAFYRALGGFRPLALMEDVDMVRRIGRRRLAALPVEAVTSAARYRRDGFVARPLRNLSCLALYMLGMPPRVLLRLYR